MAAAIVAMAAAVAGGAVAVAGLRLRWWRWLALRLRQAALLGHRHAKEGLAELTVLLQPHLVRVRA